MASALAISNLQASAALYERRIQQGQNQVQHDSGRLADSQRQLSSDRQQLAETQSQSRQAAQPAVQNGPALRLDLALEVGHTPQAMQSASAYPQLNTRGHPIGTYINVTA